MAKVIYSDNHLLVVDKPMGLLTQPDLENWGKQWMKRPYAHAVHRLDRSASGIVVIAKTSKALQRLNASMRAGLFHKTYLALIEGTLKEKEGYWEDFLIHDDHRAKMVSTGGKQAQLKYLVLNSWEHFSQLEIQLLTGRYHQIRIQCSSRGYPIIGDQKYNSRFDFFKNGIALHHYKLSFPHPITDQMLTCEAPLSSLWHSFLEKFKVHD